MSQGFRLFCLIALVGGGIAITLNLRRRSHQRRSRRTANFVALRHRGEADPALQQQLMELVGHDRQAAETWLTRARFGHGGRSEAYYWERAIALYRENSSGNPN